MRIIANRIEGVLSGRAFDVELARAHLAGQELTELPDVQAQSSLPIDDRWEICGRLLSEIPDRGTFIVWLAFEQARATNMIVEVGDVTLYDGHWWQSASSAHAPIGRLPAEIDDTERQGHWFKSMPDNGEFVLARVQLRDCFPGEAVDKARQRVNALVALAAFAEGESTWMLRSEYRVYSKTGRVQASYGHLAPEQRAKVLRGRPAEDSTGERIAQLGSHLPPFFFSEHSRVQDALAALQWFQRAREMTDAPRLAVSLRVIDQITSLLSIKKWFKFLRQEMRRTWSRHQMFTQIDNLLLDAVWVYRDPMARSREKLDGELQATMEKIGIYPQEGFNRVEFIRALPSLKSRIEFLSLRRRLAWLADQLKSGPATARWIDDLDSQFELLVDRTQRVRNAIIHGGPIVSDVVSSVTRFLAVNTVESILVWTEAGLREQHLDRDFRRRRRRLDRCYNELKRGYSPARALFWEGSTFLTR